MNYNRYSRLFTDQDLGTEFVSLSVEQSHYLANVMRRKIGDKLLIFNGREGEFLAEISDLYRKIITLKIISQTRKQRNEPNLILIFALIKNSRINFIFEKATELGISELMPITTDHSVKDKLNMNKVRAWTLEACEQSTRLTVPIIHEPKSLKDLISSWDPSIQILFANEAENSGALNTLPLQTNPEKRYAILSGPEGGFSNDEKEYLGKIDFINSFHLGPLILRAETAAICAISCVKLLLNQLSNRQI
jgi:16S rRNA (uracil1498-N3)-methyltransferase